MFNWRMNYLLVCIVLVGCQSFAGEDVSLTLVNEMTAFVTESAMMQETAIVEQTHAVETIEASNTLIAESVNVNMALVATVESNIPPTPAMRAVVVNPDDMGNSLETDMMEDSETGAIIEDSIEISGDVQVNTVGTARNINNSDGCSRGNVTQFTDQDERIYATARVSNLLEGTTFSIDWMFEERLVYRSSWTSDYSATAECIWFYMTQDDTAFIPGVYNITMYVNGQALPSQQFSINTG